MLAAWTWRQLRLVIVLGVVLCLCVSMVYIGPTFGGRSPYFLSPRIRPKPIRLDDLNSSRRPFDVRHLFISPQLTNGTHNEALGVFSQIFVISRAARLDRRAAMERLRSTLALNWTYVDAISPEDAIIARVSDRVRLLRQQNNESVFEWPLDLNPTTTTTSTISLLDKSHPSIFSMPCVTPFAARHPAIASTSGLNNHPTSKETFLMASKPRLELHDPPYMTSSSVIPLTCAVANHINGVEFSPLLPTHMILTPSKLACWYSHMSAIARFAGQAHDSRDAALFLEDDVDMEQDIHGSVELVWNFLPSGWDIIFLGHCWSNESQHPALIKIQQLESSVLLSEITLHPSFAPKCTHAYALSHSGAQRLLRHLLHPPFSYSRALDQAFSWLVETNRLKAFSLVPSIVVQRKIDKSDIDGGENGLGSIWKDCLKHGMLDF